MITESSGRRSRATYAAALRQSSGWLRYQSTIRGAGNRDDEDERGADDEQPSTGEGRQEQCARKRERGGEHDRVPRDHDGLAHLRDDQGENDRKDDPAADEREAPGSRSRSRAGPSLVHEHRQAADGCDLQRDVVAAGHGDEVAEHVDRRIGNPLELAPRGVDREEERRADQGEEHDAGFDDATPGRPLGANGTLAKWATITKPAQKWQYTANAAATA